MFLQGNLQRVFDALYHMGVIDPVLQMEWGEQFERLEKEPWILSPVVDVVNKCPGTYEELMDELKSFDQTSLNNLAMLVARELMYFHTNTVVH